MTAPHPRTRRTGQGLRILRAAVFAAVCVVLAGAGHALASGSAVPLWTLGAAFLAAAAIAAPLAGCTRSLPGIAAVLVVGQSVLHALFGLGQHATNAAPSGAALVEQATRLTCGTTAISPAQARRILTDARILPGPADAHAAVAPAGGLASDAGSSGSLLPSLPMLLVHILAALAAGWMMRRGDLALLRLAELSGHEVTEGVLMRSLRAALTLVRALCAGVPGDLDPAPRTPGTVLFTPLVPRTTALQHMVIRRGPPVAGTALVLAA